MSRGSHERHPVILHTCEICGIQTRTEQHHCVPRNALRPMGIKGTNNEDNLVNVCSNRDNDCHEVLDQKAIHERLFWNGEGFVPLSQMPEDTYVITNRYNRMPSTRRYHR